MPRLRIIIAFQANGTAVVGFADQVFSFVPCHLLPTYGTERAFFGGHIFKHKETKGMKDSRWSISRD
jgi:hypothetical protein